MSDGERMTDEELERIRVGLQLLVNGYDKPAAGTALAALRLLAEVRRLRETHIEPFLCESCGAEVFGDYEDHRCRGCGIHVCDTCVLVFEHVEDKEHGVGDPSERLADLRQHLAAAERDRDDALAEIANFDAIRAQDRSVGVLLVELAGLLGMECEVNSESILRLAIQRERARTASDAGEDRT